MAILTWVKSRQVFLKIQEGAGDALEQEDMDAGMVDYVLWSTFRPDCIDVDETLDMELQDSGMLMFKNLISALESLPDCYDTAFDKPYDDSDVIVLVDESIPSAMCVPRPETLPT